MADKTPKKAASTKPAAGIRGFNEGLRGGLGEDATKALAQIASRVQMPDFRAAFEAYRTGSSVTGDEQDLQPQVVGGDEEKKPKRKPKRTSLDRIPGRRPMKEYPLTEDDLDTIGLLQGSAAVAFGAAGTCFGLFLSVRMAVDFAGGEISGLTIGWWAGLAFGALVISILLTVAGLILRSKGKTRINRIKQDTIHDE